VILGLRFTIDREKRKQKHSNLSSYTSKKFDADEYQIVQEWRLHKHDTSYVDVEIGILSMRIEKMLYDLKGIRGIKQCKR